MKNRLIICICVNRGDENAHLGAIYSPPNYNYGSAPSYAADPSYAVAPSYSSCSQNLLVSCSPSVQQVPCSAPPQPYAPRATYAAPHLYRMANDDMGFDFTGVPHFSSLKEADMNDEKRLLGEHHHR